MKDTFSDDDELIIASYVVYDHKDGKIVHYHRIETEPGARHPSNSEGESRALELATTLRKRSPSELSVLNLGKEELEVGFKYSVDLQRKALVKGERINIPERQKP
jgi:hypothetical protein